VSDVKERALIDVDSYISDSHAALGEAAEKKLNGQVYLACTMVVGTLFFLSLDYPLLFATYLMATLCFFLAWYLNAFTSHLLVPKWLLLLGTLSSATVAILTSGGLDNPSSSWLLVVILTVAVMRNMTLTLTAITAVLVVFGGLLYVADSEWQQSLVINSYVFSTRTHQVLQLFFVIALIYIVISYRINEKEAIDNALDHLVHLNEKLTQAEAKAEQASNVKTQFLSNMSHEIRTPLNGLNGMLNLLLEQQADDRTRHYVEIALDSNKRLLELANNILDITRIEARSIELFPSDTKINTIFNDLRTDIERKAEGKGLQLHWDQEISSPWLFIDGARLEQIVHNLCDNAVKYTYVGRVAVHIHQISVGAGLSELNISITDSGVGIDTNKLEYYLSPFTQEDMSLTREQEGAGLGLALVHQLLLLMNGSMEINSDKARGTHVLVKIPIEVARQRDMESLALEKVSSAEAAPELDDEIPTVLIVEDDENNVRLLKMLLRDYKVNTFVAYSGVEAIDLVKTLPRCDLILLDYYMPIMDGQAFLERLRSGTHLNEARTVLITGSIEQDIIQKVAVYGVEDIMAKPIRTSEFEQVIAKYLHGVADPAPRDDI